MYIAIAKILRWGPNETYIPLTRGGGFALGDAKNLRHLTQKIPNANGFASQWNIGFRIGLEKSAFSDDFCKMS